MMSLPCALPQAQSRKMASVVASCTRLPSLPHAARSTAAQRRRVAPRTVRVRAEEINSRVSLSESTNSFAGTLAVAGYAAHHFGRFHVDSGLLLKALAIYTAVTAVIRLVRGVGIGNEMGSVVGPAALAAYALAYRHITFLDTVTAFSGYYLAEQLEPRSLFWPFIASLAVALYYNKGTLWYSVAAGLVAAFRLFRAYDKREALPILNVVVMAASAWAVYHHRAALWAILLYLGHTLWGALLSGKGVVDSLGEGPPEGDKGLPRGVA